MRYTSEQEEGTVVTAQVIKADGGRKANGIVHFTMIIPFSKTVEKKNNIK